MRIARTSVQPSERRRRARTPIVAAAVVVLGGLVGAIVSAGAATASVTLFSATAAPAVGSATDTNAIELGVKFSPDVNGNATGIRFFKGTSNTGTHVGTLWSNTGTALAQVTFTNETASGWQTATFASPVALVATQQYVVSYHAPAGHYAYTYSYFTNRIDNGTLSTPSDAASGGNGVYAYGTNITFPTGSNTQATNYWADIIFTPTTSTPTTTTTSTTVAPPTTTTTVPPSSPGFPDASNTGVPAGTQLKVATISTAGSGSCTLCPANVAFANSLGFYVTSCSSTAIDGWKLSQGLRIRKGTGFHDNTPAHACVTVKNSEIDGEVDTSYTTSTACQPGPCGPLLMYDTRIKTPTTDSYGIVETNYYLYRVHITGGFSSAACDGYCEVHDSFMHDQYAPTATSHVGGFHDWTSTTPVVLDHSTFSCNIVNAQIITTGGCTAALVLNPSPASGGPMSNVIVRNNLLLANSGAEYYSAYSGQHTSGVFSTNITWSANVWQICPTLPGASGCLNKKTGQVPDWEPTISAANNDRWCNNRFDDGTLINAGYETNNC